MRYLHSMVFAFLSSITILNGTVQANELLELRQARYAADSCQAMSRSLNPLVPQVAFSAEAKAICISGYIDWALASAVEREISAGQRDIDHIVVESDGGEVAPSIRISEKIEPLEATVVVRGRCASSCAQFLFVTPQRKVILKGGHVLFHGGPIPEEKIMAMSIALGAREQLLREQWCFRKFYSDRNIDMRMLTQPPVEAQEALNRGALVMWSWPSEKLVEFGVSGVIQE